MFGQVALQARQRLELALDASMAGAQHAERIIEAGGGVCGERVGHGRLLWASDRNDARSALAIVARRRVTRESRCVAGFFYNERMSAKRRWT